MPQIRFPGLATGIDTGEIVRQLVEVESRSLRAKEEEKADQQIRSETLSELQTKLTAFRTKIRALADNTKLQAFNSATSDSDFITASANYNASEGSHSIQVKQLATTDRWVHDGLKYTTSYVKDPGENGVFILSYNHQEMVIQTTDTTTLEDLAALINNDADNPGITASVLNYDAGNDQVYHLVLSSQDSGGDYQISINSSNTEVHTADSTLQHNAENAEVTTKISELDSFSGTIESGSTADQIRVQGNQHDSTAVDYYFDVTQYTTIEDLLAEIEDAFSGSATATYSDGQITLTDDFSGTSSMTLTLTFIPGTDSTASITLPTFSQTTQGGSTDASLASLASSTFTETQSAQDAKIRVDGYPPDSAAIAEVQHLTNSDRATGGHFHLTYDGYTTGEIDRRANTDTIQAALELLPNVNTGDIIVSGDKLDKDGGGTTVFTFLDTAGDVSLLSIDTSAMTSEGTHVMSEYTQGDDGRRWISRSTNTIDDVLAGVTLNLHDDTYNTTTSTYDSIEVTLTRNTEALKDKLNEMIEAYNEIVTFLQEKADYDPETKTAPILYGEHSITTIRNQIKNPFVLAAGGFTSDDTFTMPKNIGLTINTDGLLELDGNEFDEALPGVLLVPMPPISSFMLPALTLNQGAMM